MPSRFSPTCRTTGAGHRSTCCSSPIAHRQSKAPLAVHRGAIALDGVRIDDDRVRQGRSWDALVKESTAAQRDAPLNSKWARPRSSVAFLLYPMKSLSLRIIKRVPAVVEAYPIGAAAASPDRGGSLSRAARSAVRARLPQLFETAALTMASHFLGRDFVCGIFSWPAGGGRGILLGCDFDPGVCQYAVEDL